MIIVSDTSPIRYLVLVEAECVLPAIFGEIIIPPAVHRELRQPNTPELVRNWAARPPTWLTVQAPIRVDPGLDLHIGEAEAISLALELRADRLLIDDRKGRATARRLSVRPIGTLAVLEAAAEMGLVDLSSILARLKQTNFHITEAMIRGALRRKDEREEKA